MARTVLIAWLMLGPAWLSAQKPPAAVPEYDLKLAFLYNFLKYVEWKGKPASELLVCAAGQNPFGDAFFATMRDQVNGRPIKGEVIPEPDDRCHVVFVPLTAKGGYVREARGKAVLTVGETDDFLREGGIIRFVTEGTKLRFEINAEQAERVGIHISPSLLRLRHNAGNPVAK